MNHRLVAALSASASRTAIRDLGSAVAAGSGTAAGSVAAARVPGPAPGEPMPGPLLLDLIAAVVHGGAPPQSALAAVGAALSEVHDPSGEELLLAASTVGHALTPFPAGDPGAAGFTGAAGVARGAGATGPPVSRSRLLAVVREALLLAARSGLPPTALIRRAAAEERRRQLSAQLRAIRKLEVLLVIPAGLCLLPAFVLLGIVPLVIDLVTG